MCKMATVTVKECDILLLPLFHTQKFCSSLILITGKIKGSIADFSLLIKCHLALWQGGCF